MISSALIAGEEVSLEVTASSEQLNIELCPSQASHWVECEFSPPSPCRVEDVVCTSMQ